MPQIKLTITFDTDQAKVTNVSGPIDQKILAYGMLEGARDEIALYHAKKANGSPIVTAGAAMLGEGRN